MNTNNVTKKILTACATVLIIVALISCAALFLDYLDTRTRARLNLLLNNVQPGMTISEAKITFGEPTRKIDDIENMLTWGTIQNKSIIENCSLTFFWHAGIPYRYILVYIDNDSGKIKFITTQNM